MKDQKVRKLAFSGMTIAVYVVLMYLTQSISFGAYQIRIATALYALSWPFPFLALPLALANMLSNLLFGGMGILDIAGGFLIGIMTTMTINLIKRSRLPRAFIALPILLIPGLGAPIWISRILGVPYGPLALSVTIGQAVPALCGPALAALAERSFKGKESF